jgi:hypothetical protein
MSRFKVSSFTWPIASTFINPQEPELQQMTVQYGTYELHLSAFPEAPRMYCPVHNIHFSTLANDYLLYCAEELMKQVLESPKIPTWTRKAMSTTSVVITPHTSPKTPFATVDEPMSTSICVGQWPYYNMHRSVHGSQLFCCQKRGKVEDFS